MEGFWSENVREVALARAVDDVVDGVLWVRGVEVGLVALIAILVLHIGNKQRKKEDNERVEKLREGLCCDYCVFEGSMIVMVD